MTLDSLLREYYAPTTGISARTERLYGFTISAFGEFLGEQPTLEHLDELAVARFLSWRLRNRSAGTTAKDRAQLRALWEWAARHGMVRTWPSIRPVRVPERTPRAWMIDEFRRLIESAGEEPGEIVGVPASSWWRAILIVGFEVGERIGGLLSIEWTDVDSTGVRIRAEGRKGGRRDLWRPISPECMALVESIRTDRRLVFDWDRAYSTLWYHLGRICKRAGLPDDRMSKFHRVRKTTASYAAAGGLDPQMVMDHSSPQTTRRYLDPRIIRQRHAVDVLPPAFLASAAKRGGVLADEGVGRPPVEAVAENEVARVSTD
jgi:integrase